MSGTVDASDEFIGRYQNIEDLGVGGYSRVKLALDTKTKNYVAVKILLSEPATVNNEKNGDVIRPIKWTISDSKKKQCKREIELMRQIKHKNVVQLVDFIEEATFPQKDEDQGNALVPTPCLCVVLEYCSRGELFDFLMYTGRLGERATRTYFHQFLAGLKAMHDSGYAHRDLKPENLLLSDDFTLKIADFGFATQFKNNQHKIKMATTCGTKGYLAPELLAGKKYTHKVDLFAVGIIMFTTFAGFPPFQHAGQGDWWWDKMSKAWTYWNESMQAPNESDRVERGKKGSEKMRLFWAAHERSLPFDDKFKDLMQQLLNPFPKQRYDIDDCLKHPWMTGGKMFSRRQLVKYMKQYSSTVRTQRAIKIDKQLKDQNMESQRKNAGKTRAQLAHETPDELQRQANAYTAAVEKIEAIPPLVTKANFRFESSLPMIDILTGIDIAARKNEAQIDLEIEKCEVKIIASVTRQRTTEKKNKHLEAAGWQAEDVQIAVKIYNAKLAEIEYGALNPNFDLEGNFLGDDDGNDDIDDPMDDDKSDDEDTQSNQTQKWAVFFYRLKGSADGFQQLMSKIYYDPLVSSLMNYQRFVPTDGAVYNKIAALGETARAFAESFKEPPRELVSEEDATLPGELPAPNIE